MNVTRYKCSVLAVDDDPAILTLLSRQLGNDFEVLTASSVGQARGLLAQRSVDIVLTDLKLPDEPGLSLLDWVRRTTPRTSRILITGTARLEDAADAINQTQVHRLVLKPWRSEDLLQSLRAVSRALLLERSHEQLLDEMRRLNLELEQRVNERTHELNERTHELEIALSQLQQKNMMLEKMSLTDSLTGLSNRRALDRIARSELQRRSRIPIPLTIVLIDVDHFKEVNTNFLHPGGDHTLIWLAGVLQNSIRALDSLGRVGGEEFQVIAPNTDTSGAMVLAERLRENVAAGSTIYNGNTVQITISLGVAVIESSLMVAYDDLRECAAKALKEAKDAGRNCSVVRQYTLPAN